MWVKICGLTTPEGVDAAIAAGVDAVGFVFALSKRQVTVERAAILARGVPSHIARVAVMLHPSQALVDEVMRVVRPDILQTDAGDLATLRVPAGVAVVPVLRDAQSGAPVPKRVLFEGKVSGSGATADWASAARIARVTQLILAGGLDADNVATAIAEVAPFGVDVSSGVEREPGIKDPGKIMAFVSAAREALTVQAKERNSR
jgi:phosphoribosylanthranilate isomerase